jgi:hypothetical protein
VRVWMFSVESGSCVSARVDMDLWGVAPFWTPLTAKDGGGLPHTLVAAAASGRGSTAPQA